MTLIYHYNCLARHIWGCSFCIHYWYLRNLKWWRHHKVLFILHVSIFKINFWVRSKNILSRGGFFLHLNYRCFIRIRWVEVALVGIIWFKINKQLARIQIWFTTRYMRQWKYFRCHWRFVLPWTIYLRIALINDRLILLAWLIFLITPLTTLFRTMRKRASACSICVWKFRLALGNNIKGLFLFIETRITLIFHCTLSLIVKSLRLMDYYTWLFLILLASYLTWSKLVNIFIKCRWVIIKTFTWICWTQAWFFLA